MLKRIIDCTYKEVREYYKRNIGDWQVGCLLASFGSQWLRNESSWLMRIKYEFPKLFKGSLLTRKIDV